MLLFRHILTVLQKFHDGWKPNYVYRFSLKPLCFQCLSICYCYGFLLSEHLLPMMTLVSSYTFLFSFQPCKNYTFQMGTKNYSLNRSTSFHEKFYAQFMINQNWESKKNLKNVKFGEIVLPISPSYKQFRVKFFTKGGINCS